MNLLKKLPRLRALPYLASTAFALTLSGCFQTDPELTRAPFIPVRLNTTPEPGLKILAGKDTVTSPGSVMVRPDTAITVSVPGDQVFDRSGYVPGIDTRFVFQGWVDSSLRGDTLSIKFERGDSLSARFGKQYKILIATRTGSAINVFDSSWRWEGANFTVSAPDLANADFLSWSVNGGRADSARFLSLKATEPLFAQAQYARVCSLTVQSDWTAGFALRLNDSVAITPVRKRLPAGSLVKLAFPAVTGMDASPYVDGEDVRLEAFLRRRPDQSGLDTIFSLDTTTALVIPTRRAYKVVVRVTPDSSGEFTLVTEPKDRAMRQLDGVAALPKKGLAEGKAKQDSASQSVPQPQPTLDPQAPWYAENTVLHLAARERDGFFFSHWTLDGQTLSSLDTVSLQVKWPGAIEAVFLPGRSLRVATWPDTTLDLEIGGRLTRAPLDTVLESTVELPSLGTPAVQERHTSAFFQGPDTRFVFDHWRSDGSTENPRSLSPKGPWSREADFRAWHKLAFVDAPPGGPVDSSLAWLPQDTVVKFAAHSSPEYSITYWEVNGVRQEGGDTLTIAVTQPLLVRPRYAVRALDQELSKLFAVWRPALGSAGGDQAVRLISARSGTCPAFTSGNQIQAYGDSLRARLMALSGLRADRRALSHAVQRRFQGPGYSIEVVRLEVFPGIYLPLNVYLPDDKDPASCPLIVTPPGYEEGVSTDLVQQRSANFALQGMVVLVPEGLNGNGVRAAYESGGNNYLGYGRELLGMPSPNSVFLQELISSITWAVETFPQVDPGRIGAAGYSYGGAMSLELGEFDPRVRTLSLPATLYGGDCSGMTVHSDLYVESNYGPGFVWSPPPELPMLPTDFELAMIYPRSLQSIAGELDEGAPPAAMGPVLAKAKEWWGLDGHADRIFYSTDDGNHNYLQPRREASYAWFSTSLPDTATVLTERQVPIFDANELEPNLAGSSSLVNKLYAAVDSASQARFQNFSPTGDYPERVAQGMEEVYGNYVPRTLVQTSAWSAVSPAGLRIHAFKIEAGSAMFPVFAIENPTVDSGEALYLPRDGVLADSSGLIELVARYRKVYCVDYLGIGELKSNSIMTHTLARQLMFDEANLPRFIVDGLRAWLETRTGRVDIHANGWASSFFGASLKYLEPTHCGRFYPSGVPDDEIKYLASGNKIPDLLLRGGLFVHLSELEIETAASQRP
ncbi:MAG: acetylxylan esterase [Fibrobacteres bacterium]|nr:acetylxylan esterase [Fibrobacterota bacterium]